MYKGEKRKLLVRPIATATYTFFDRNNGKFLSAVPFVEKLNWARALCARTADPQRGKTTVAGTRVCPWIAGATIGLRLPTVSPHAVYFLTRRVSNVFSRPNHWQFRNLGLLLDWRKKRIPGESGRNSHGVQPRDRVVCVEISAGWLGPFFGWNAEHAEWCFSAAVGSFEAVDAQTGKPLWHFNTGRDFSASPMTYAVAGKQYVAIAGGGDVFCCIALSFTILILCVSDLYQGGTMKSAFTRRNFGTKLASMLSTMGIGAAVLGKTASAETSTAQDTGVQKLNYDGKPADGTQMITSLIVHNGLIYISGQGANDAGDVQGADITSHTTKVMNNVKKLVEAGGGSMDSILQLTVYLGNLDSTA
jgi:enamine deaminase RidA (YjgF/YER057c/UK114 family)